MSSPAGICANRTPPAGAARVLGGAAAILRGVPLPPGVPGRLWLSAMPGRFEPFKTFLSEARRHHVGLVLCLAPLDELAVLSPAYRTAVTQGTLPFRWLNLPMRNYGLPPDLPDFHDGIAQAAGALRAGDAVLLHCAAGLGRTGSAAACLLKSLGLPTEEALQRVRDAGSNPQTAQQTGLVERF
ncbi:protein-tyrosine phosphatase family protein [Azohydromonas aeria]|uniref:protein-tyrosine phosphatase family protein n=1 Tax=Azohydromonas aeria TaxID=2590212 RepID=UPI0012FC91B2|nr:tyrosine-protein phosphatase [Azohydromonas aeria]